QLDPRKRWTASQARRHPFIQGKPLKGGEDFELPVETIPRPPLRIPPIPLNMILLNSNPSVSEFYPEHETPFLFQFNEQFTPGNHIFYYLHSNLIITVPCLYPHSYQPTMAFSPPENFLQVPCKLSFFFFAFC